MTTDHESKARSIAEEVLHGKFHFPALVPAIAEALREADAAKDDRIAELCAAIKPFAEFGVNVIDGAWTSNIHRESISTWFGPSDFCAAHRAMIKAEKEIGE